MPVSNRFRCDVSAGLTVAGEGALSRGPESAPGLAFYDC
jgi:hypothetical protein